MHNIFQISNLRRPGLSGMAAIVMLSSCVTEELYDTPHPLTGTVTVTADWSGRSADAVIPGSYTLQIGEFRQEVSETTNLFARQLAPGNHELTGFNIPQGMTRNATSVAVAILPDNTIVPEPGHLFIGRHGLEITADTDISVVLPMKQYTRRLELELTVVQGGYERVATAVGSLSGICGSVAVATGTRSDEAMLTVADVVREGDRFRLAYNLLGIVRGASQTLTIEIAFTNGDTQTIESDLTGLLSSYNDDNTPLRLSGNLLLPVEGGMTGNIIGWQVADGGNSDAH